MCKKIYSCIVIVGFSGVVFGMERKSAQDIVPVLAVNDYIITVPTAYQALCKEVFFERYMLRLRIKEANKLAREFSKKKGMVYRLPDAKTCERVTKYTLKPCFTVIECVCRNDLEFESFNQLNADINISTLIYQVVPSQFRSVTYWQDRYSLQHFSASVTNNVARLVPIGKVVFIELYSPDKISDWISIENRFEVIDFNKPDDDGDAVVVAEVISQEDSSLFHKRDEDYNPIDQLGLNISFYSCVVGAVIMTAALLGSSLYN